MSTQKGKLHGNCNRTACQCPDALYFNTSTRAYYCLPCASKINTWAIKDSGFGICFLTQGEENDAGLKYGKATYDEMLAREGHSHVQHT